MNNDIEDIGSADEELMWNSNHLMKNKVNGWRNLLNMGQNAKSRL